MPGFLPWLAIATAVAAATATSVSPPSQDTAAGADPPGPPTAANFTGPQDTAVVPVQTTGPDLQAANRVTDDLYLSNIKHYGFVANNYIIRALSSSPLSVCSSYIPSSRDHRNTPPVSRNHLNRRFSKFWST